MAAKEYRVVCLLSSKVHVSPTLPPIASPERDVPLVGRRAESILLTLRQELEAGRYAPHTRLPTEGSLCERFGASRTTIRKAVSRLVAEGRVSVARGSGMYALPRTKNGTASCTLSVMFPFDEKSLAKAQSHALRLGFLTSVFTHADWSPETERQFLERVLRERHHALLAFCTPLGEGNDDLLEELARQGVRVIHVEHYRANPPRQSFVLPDYRRGGELAANSLMIEGHRHFRFVQVDGDGPHSQLAWEGFQEALLKHGRSASEKKTRIYLPRHFEKTEEGMIRFQQFADSLPEGAGLFARSVDLAENLQNLLKRALPARPEAFGLIGIKHLLNYRSGGGVDCIDYDWDALLIAALDAAAAPTWKGVQTWIQPHISKVSKAAERHRSGQASGRKPVDGATGSSRRNRDK